jgi:thiamine-monophosphate kinase
MSSAFVAEHGGALASRMFAATGGDDYALLAAMPADVDLLSLSLPAGSRVTAVGSLAADGPPLRLISGGQSLPLPEKLGHEHRGDLSPPMADRP